MKRHLYLQPCLPVEEDYNRASAVTKGDKTRWSQM